MSGTTRRWVPPLLLALATTFFWRLWLAPDGFLYHHNPYSDLTITHWPNALFIRQSLATWGQVPLWRPLILGGEPFAANPLSGLWYPPNLLLLLLPLTPAFNLLFVLHAAWAGWGGYRLARTTGASRDGGMLAALTVMFAPKAVAHLAAGHVGLYCAWAWLPWTFWAVRRLAERGRSGDIATAAGAAAMLILADVRLGFYGGLAAGGYWVVGAGLRAHPLWGNHSDYKGGDHKGRPYTGGVVAALLAAALVAGQVVPLATVAGRLNRGGLTLGESGIASLPPRYLAGLLVADHGGFQEWMTYLGAVGLILALVGMIRWRGWERWWWGGLALAAGIYSLGTYTPLYGLLHRVLPPLGWLRGPARAWFLVVLAVGVLAAQGLAGLGRRRGSSPSERAITEGRLYAGGARRRRWTNQVAAGLAGAALAGGGGGLVLHLPANVVMAAVVWPLAGMLIALRAGGRLRDPLFAHLALVLALADLWGLGFALYQVRPSNEVLAEGKAAAAWLAAQPRPFRVYSPSYSIPQHTGAVYGIETADGVDPFQLADYAAFMRAATRVDLPGYSVTIPSFPEVAEEEMLLAHRDVVPDLRLLGLLNVRYLAAAYPMDAEGLVGLGEWDGVHISQNEQALPRAFVVRRVEIAEGLEGALSWLAENDPSQAAVVDGGQPLQGPAGVQEARLVVWTPNRIQVEAEGPGLLVLGEVYDPDWRAEVDGQATEVVRTDGILRGVYLEEGCHQVTFVYRTAGLAVGIGVTTVGWMCATALWVAGWAKAHR